MIQQSPAEAFEEKCCILPHPHMPLPLLTKSTPLILLMRKPRLVTQIPKLFFRTLFEISRATYQEEGRSEWFTETSGGTGEAWLEASQACGTHWRSTSKQAKNPLRSLRPDVPTMFPNQLGRDLARFFGGSGTAMFSSPFWGFRSSGALSGKLPGSARPRRGGDHLPPSTTRWP